MVSTSTNFYELFNSEAKPHAKFFVGKHFLFSQTKKAMSHIAQVVTLSHINAKIVAMVGDSGVGKTAITKEVKKLLNNNANGLTHQCVYTELVTNVSAKGIFDALLIEMGISIPSTYREKNSLDHLVRMLLKFQTRLIIIDETQHALPHNSDKKAKTQAVANALKLLHDKSNVSILLVGLNSVKSLINNHFFTKKSRDHLEEKQIGRRSYAHIQLRPIDLKVKKEFPKSLLHEVLTGFKLLFNEIHEQFGVSILDLNDYAFAKRMWVASEGLIGLMAPIFENALLIVNSGEQITYETLAQAYEAVNTNDEETASLFAIEMGINPFECSDSELNQLVKTISANRYKYEQKGAD